MSIVVKLLAKDTEYYRFSVQENVQGRFGPSNLKKYHTSLFTGMTDQQCIDLVRTFQSMNDSVCDVQECEVIEEEQEVYQLDIMQELLKPYRVIMMSVITFSGFVFAGVMGGNTLASDPLHNMTDQQKVGFYQEQIQIIEGEKQAQYDGCVEVCELQGGTFDGEIQKKETEVKLLQYGMMEQ